MQINLISDTITKPSRQMLDFMVNAEVGDDVFASDPTVNALQIQMSEMFGMEDALFCPSGTMTNQIAIKMHTKALDELICEENSHVFQYETGGYAFNSSVAVNLIRGKYGKLEAQQILDAVKPIHDWLPISKMVVIENSTNKGGGNYYTLAEIAKIQAACKEKSLKLHLDGARLFNVLVETGESTKDVGKYFDSISICLSKGLGAPIGSVLIGSKEEITQARRYRKVMGGGMRQAGVLAAAGIFALNNNIARLKEDNDRAKLLGKCLENCSYVESIQPVKTNIIIFTLKDWTAEYFLNLIDKHDILAAPFGHKQVRFVTHMHFDDNQLEKASKILRDLENT